MIDLKKLRLYPFYTNSLAITKDLNDEFYNIIFYPENTSFSLAYPKMQIPKRFVRYGTVLPSILPRIVPNPKTLSQFYSNKISPIRINKSFITNLFIDVSVFLQLLDAKFKKGNYRRSIILSKIFSYLNSVKAEYPNRKNVLLYYVDLNQPIADSIWNRRATALYAMFNSKEGIPFDYVMLGIQSEGTVKYTLLSKPDGSISSSRLFTVFKSLKSIMLTDQSTQDDEKITDFSKNVVNTVQGNHDQESLGQGQEIAPIVNLKMQKAIKSYVQRMPEDEQVAITSQAAVHPDDANKLTIASTLFSITRDKKRSDNITDNIKPENYTSTIKSIKTELSQSILEDDTFKNESRDAVFSKVSMNSVNENKNPSKILSKRKVDFTKSFESDLLRSFKLLETKKTFPLKVVKFKKESLAVDPGDLEPTKTVRYSITMQDEKKKNHEVVIDLPEIQDDGTFMINGSKKYLIFQIIIDPIFFIKPTEAKLETMFSTVATHHKLTKHKSYFNTYIAGYELPTFLVLSYAIGFYETCKLFGIQTSIVDAKPEDKNLKVYEMTDGKFMIFTFTTPEARILINSLYEMKGIFDTASLTSKEAIHNLLIKQTDNRNCIFQIDTVLDNIMEPIAVQILKTKLLPTTFSGCIYYICKGLANNLIYNRNDISKQRIRSSEIFNYQIQKLILGSYNEYRQKKEHGDEDAQYYCDTKQIVSNIVNSSKMIRSLENINPYEELSSLTRVTPIGPGGLADDHSVIKSARNINDSYYGNFDPMDTPENGTIGVINQLTIDAAMGSSRGSFGKFEDKDIKSSCLSPSSACVPFVSSDDGCRVMLQASQTKQAIPVLGAEQPLVQTGFETVMTSMLTDSYVKKSPVDGEIIRQSGNAVYVKDAKGKNHVVPLDTKILRSAQGKSSLNYFTSVVKDSQRVKAGQILAEGKHIKDGVISVGCNLLTAIMGWKGYAFEDGYIISDRVASQKYTSTSYEEITIDIKATSTIKQIAKEGDLTKKGDVLIVRSSKEVEELLGIEEEELIEGQQVKRSPGGKIIAIEVYPNISIKKFPVLIPAFENFKRKWEEMKGPFPERFLTNEHGSKTPFSGIRVVFKIERYDVSIVGDKLANSHGGKGVITLVEKVENMPVTPWGEPIDIILNPVAVINRMNPGTIYEMYTGLIAKFLAKQLVAMGPVKTEKAMKLVANIYTSMDATKDKSLSRSIVRSFSSLSDKQYSDYIKKIQSSGYILPIIVPPFQVPSKEMISKTLKMAGLKSAYNLKLPEYNTMTKNPVAIGYLYYKKLEQQAEYKINARSIGKYATGTSQPTAGASAGGGQRLGEFDTWAIAAHGAETLLRELLGPLSDNKKLKDEILFDIIQKGEAKYRESTSGATKSTLEVYLASMMLNAKL